MLPSPGDPADPLAPYEHRSYRSRRRRIIAFAASALGLALAVVMGGLVLVVRDPAGGQAYAAARVRTRGSVGWCLSTPPDASVHDEVFLVWLLHLLDLRGGRAETGLWVPRDGRWWNVPASLGPRLGQGGLGDRFAAAVPS